MSKTQEKRARRKAEQQAFLRERKEMQLAMFEQAFDTGLRIYEANKEKLSAQEVEVIEKDIEANRALIDKLRRELDGPVISNPQT